MKSSNECSSGMEEAPDGARRALDAAGVDIEMGRESQAIEPRRKNAVLLQMRQQLSGARSRRAHQVDEQQIRLRRLDLKLVDAGQPLRQLPGKGVILRETVD